MSNVLDLELQTYQKHKEELLEKEAGRFVLIKDDKIIAVFDTERDAIEQGRRELGNVPFLVEEICQYKQEANYISNW